MKALIRIFVDDYETNAKNFKVSELAAIRESIRDYMISEKTNFNIDLSSYMDPVALNVLPEFMEKINNKRFQLYPYGFNKNLKIQMDYINTDNFVCNCYDLNCYGKCGTLECGCIDVCRNKCGLNMYDSY
jgi:hypothetical protein